MLLSQDARNVGRSAVDDTADAVGPPIGAGQAPRRSTTVIASFGLERFRDHRTAQLSTGTRRVVDLASVVLAEPRLLLARRADRRHRATRGGGVHPAVAAAPRGRGHDDRARRARRAARVRAVLQRRGHGDRPGGGDRHARRGRAATRGRWPPTSARARTRCWCRVRRLRRRGCEQNQPRAEMTARAVGDAVMSQIRSERGGTRPGAEPSRGPPDEPGGGTPGDGGALEPGARRAAGGPPVLAPSPGDAGADDRGDRAR